MKLHDALRDLVQTISGMDFECIEVTSDSEGTSFKAYTLDKVMIMRARTKEPIEGIGEGRFGIGNLSLLQGLMNLKTYSGDDSSIEYDASKHRLVFNCTGASTDFVLTRDDFVPAQPRATERPYDITVDPNTAKISELKSFSSVFKSLSSVVTPYTENGDLKFFVGSSGKNNHNGVLSFAKTEQELNRGYGYSIDRLMQCTSRIGNAESKSLNISGTGILNITLNTGIIEYKFFIQGE